MLTWQSALVTLFSFCMLETVTTLLSSHVINSITNFWANTRKTYGKYSQPANLCNTLASNTALKWRESFPSLTSLKESSVYCLANWDNTKRTLAIFWLEMVTTSENNSVCEGKMTIFASFLLTDFFNMVDRTDPCAFSNS